MATIAIQLPKAELAEFCRQNQIRRLSLFGSALTDRFGPESDVDLLVEFEPGARISYFDLARMEISLTDLVGRQVDLRTPKELSRYFRDKVVATSEQIYERG